MTYFLLYLQALREYLNSAIQELHLDEFYTVDVKRTVQQFTNTLQGRFFF